MAEKKFAFGPEMSVILLVAGLGLLAWSYSIEPAVMGGEEETVDLPDGVVPDGNKSICIDCIFGAVGGGCTYVDEITGETVQPKGCFTPKEGLEKIGCIEDQRGAEFCTMQYEPVCGSDARDYGNPCVACSDPNVFYYIPGTCEDARAEGQ